MSKEVRSPLPAKVLEVHVKPGDAVAMGTVVVTLESMKMEMPIEAEEQGTVSYVSAEVGQTVAKDTVLVVID